MKETTRKNMAKFLLWFGLVLMAFGILTKLVNSQDVTIAGSLFVAGLILVILYPILDFSGFVGFFKARQTRFGFVSLLYTLAFLILIGFINYISTRHEKRIDITKDKLYTLSPQSKTVLKKINKELKILAFYSPSERTYEKLNELLNMYKYENKNIKIEFIDPYKHPDKVEKYKITSDGKRIVIKYEKREVKVKEITEEAITKALISITKSKTPKIYFVVGHGEESIEDKSDNGLKDFADALKGEGYDAKTLNLSTSKVPEDASCVILANPQTQLLTPELNALKDYLDKGGRMAVFVEPTTNQDIRTFLENYGVTFSGRTIVDRMSRIFNMGANIPVIFPSKGHPINKNFEINIFFPTATDLSEVKDHDKSLKIQKLATTSPASWADSDISSGVAKFDPATDRKGPVEVAMTVTKKIGTQKDSKDEMRLAVFGDSGFITQKFINFSGNKDFALNTINWLTQREEMITIRPKRRKGGMIFLTKVQANILQYGTLYVLPLIFFGLAVFTFRRRRRK